MRRGPPCKPSWKLWGLAASPLGSAPCAFGDTITWCGWKFNFRSETVRLEPDKLAKLALQEVLVQKKVNKKALQSCLRLVNWATAISHQLRSYAAPLCSDLGSAPGILCSIHSHVWQILYSLDAKAVVVKPDSGRHVPVSSKVIEVGSGHVSSKSDVPLLPNSERLTWVRVADPTPSDIAFTESSKESLSWLLSCVQATPTKPVAAPLCFTASLQQTPWQRVTPSA